MTNTQVTLESIDAKLEHVVSVFVQLADEQAQSFRQSNERLNRIEHIIEQSNERLTRLEIITERQAKVAEQQAEVAQSQAESVRELVRLLNQKSA